MDLEKKLKALDEAIARTHEGIGQRLDESIRTLEENMSVSLRSRLLSPAPEPPPAGQDIPKNKTAGFAGGDFIQQLFESLEPLASEISQAKDLVFNSPHIQNNPLYKKRAEDTSFAYVGETMHDPTSGEALDESIMNAFATDSPDLPGGVNPPAIFLFAGLARAISLASLAVSLTCVRRNVPWETRRVPLLNTFKFLGRAIIDNGGVLPMETCRWVFQEAMGDEVQGLAQDMDALAGFTRSFRWSMYMAVTAHELGHIAYGHTLGDRASYQVSRGQEFDADSFASQVLATSPYSEYHFLGQVITTVLFAWIDAAAKIKHPSTHPLGKDRFEEMFRDRGNPEARRTEEQFGLGYEKLAILLPGS